MAEQSPDSPVTEPAGSAPSGKGDRGLDAAASLAGSPVATDLAAWGKAMDRALATRPEAVARLLGEFLGSAPSRGASPR